jgi:hypothetical protein
LLADESRLPTSIKLRRPREAAIPEPNLRHLKRDAQNV